MEAILARVDGLWRAGKCVEACQALDELDPDRETVVVCHHGLRSLRVAYFLQSRGFSNLYNLQGGVDAWAHEIDASMQKY